jgi:ketol-acid reductoisomerase
MLKNLGTELVFGAKNTLKEIVYRGGRSEFPFVKQVLDTAGIKRIGVIGWGSQASAQAQNLRDTLHSQNSDTTFKVGLRAESESIAKAQSVGFEVDSVENTVRDSDLVMLLISDSAQTKMYENVFGWMKSGATLGLSHGFLIKYLDNVGYTPRSDINIVGVCPKGMGPSVRKLYELGKTTDGAGINSSIVVEQTSETLDMNENKVHAYFHNVPLAWAIGIGSPSVFNTTFRDECVSDLVGERGILLGALHGIVESLFIHNMHMNIVDQKYHPSELYHGSFMDAKYLTGQLSKQISKHGLLNVYKTLKKDQQVQFRHAYVNAYQLTKPLIEELYLEVDSGTELTSVVNRTKLLEEEGFELDKVSGNSPFWNLPMEHYKIKGLLMHDDHAFNSGVYIGVMMAQVDTLLENGHSFTEVVNESITEAVDSLNPYMYSQGIDYMIDNCSVTARVGARKWSPRFQQVLINGMMYNEKITNDPSTAILFSNFKNHEIHQAEEQLRDYKPSF